jgi:hypothetical protein
MRSAVIGGILTLAAVGAAQAQRPVRLGPIASLLSLDEGSATEQFASYGAAIALRTGDDGEAGVVAVRAGDLSAGDCRRSLTFVGLESYYYPVGASGVAPFAVTALGLARVHDEDPGLLGVCVPSQPSNELGVTFGLGVRLNVGTDVVGLVEGRFFQAPHSALQALEGRAGASVALGRVRHGGFVAGTVGPSVALLIALDGPFRARGPAIGARFRRDLQKGGTVGLEIHHVPLEVTASCSTGCDPSAILFAPGYEAALHPSWGRLYAQAGALLAGFPGQGPDRGMSQGAHGGAGVDLFAGERLLANIGARVLWLQRGDGDNAFLLQVGLSVGPRVPPRTR